MFKSAGYCLSVQCMEKRRKPCSQHDLLVCMCVRTVRGALWEQCSVQFRSEQRRPRPGQSQSSGNPRVFRSPGPYLMSLSKKKVALSRAFLSHCLPLALLFPSFSHTPSDSTSPEATLRMNEFQVFTQQLWLSHV